MPGAMDPPHVPAEIWERADVVDALRSRDIGALFTLLRRHVGLSQTRLGTAVGMSQATVSQIIAGRQRVTALDVFERIADGLAMPTGARHLLGLAGTPTASPPERPDAVEPWDLAEILSRSSVPPALADRFERVALGQVALYPRTPPPVMWPLVQQELNRVGTALAQRQSIAVQRRLVRVLGVLSGLAGHLATDRGDPAAAFDYFDVARMAGHEAEDDDLAAWAVALASIEPYVNGNPTEALPYLDEAAQLAAGPGSSARRRAWIAALQARAYAAVGQTAAAQAALDRAYLELEDAAAPAATDFFDHGRLDGMAGQVWMLLGDSRQAADLVTRAIGQRSADDAKGRAMLTLDKAAILAAEDTEAACATVHEAIDVANGQIVRPIILRAQQVTHRMASCREAPAVRGIADRLSEIAGGDSGPR